MATFLLNVGLVTKSGVSIPYEVALNIVDEFVMVEEHHLQCSDTEPTLVARITTTHSRHALTTISNILAQDCIAVYDLDANEGALIGKNVTAWGSFDATQFLCLDGTRLG